MARTIFTKDPVKFIPALADALKDVPEFEVPEWAHYVKTGVSRERPPVMDDFWYTRAASILRQLYIKGVVGVGKLRTKYGSRKDRGGRPDKFFKSGGKIIRVILQQGEAAGLVEKVTRMQHGRRLTAAGRDFLDAIEVEEKAGLNFEEISVKPMEMVDPQDANFEEVESVEVTEEDTAQPQVPSDEGNVEEAVEETTEVEEDKGEVEVEEDKDKSEAEVEKDVTEEAVESPTRDDSGEPESKENVEETEDAE